jgi:hypothetical protein
MLRLRLPQIVSFQGELDMSGKNDDDQMMGEMSPIKGKLRRLAATIDWNPVQERFAKFKRQEDLIPEITGFLWQRPDLKPPAAVLQNHTEHSTPEKLLKTTYIQLMATPEYQLS